MTAPVSRDDVRGTLGIVENAGAVQLVHRVHARIEDVWAALTDPDHLDRWLGELRGDLRIGGRVHARYHASGWQGTLRILRCERPRYIAVATSSATEADGEIDVSLTATGDNTDLVVQDKGVPLAHLAAYGGGDHIHIEDLAAYLAGRGRCDPGRRWRELRPEYDRQAADLLQEQ